MAQAIARRSRALAPTRAPQTTPRPEPTAQDRRRRADAALVAADDALLASAEELAALADPDLPTGLRGDEEMLAPFAAALTAAQADLDAACALRQQAAEEADAGAEAGLLAQVEQLARAANARLDEQSRAFDAVRNLDQSVGTVLPALTAKAAQLRGRLDESEQLAGELTERFGSGALASARADLQQAADRVAFAEASLEVAGELLRTGDRRGAIARARAAEAALRQACVLLDELAGTPDALERASTDIGVLLDQTRTDLNQARSAGTLPPSAPAVRFAAATVEWVTGTLGRPVDPVATRRALLESDSALVRALGAALDPTLARRRAETLADCFADAAGSSLRLATTAIATRRAVVGADARLRLAAARRVASSATQDEPVRRVEHLHEADRLAEQALALAHSDEARAHDRVTAVGGPVTHHLAAAVVGGILVRPSAAAEQEDEGSGAGTLDPAAAIDPAATLRRFGQMAAVSFGGRATRARRGGAGRF